MLSVNDCREVLEQFNYQLDDEEIETLRDFLTMLAMAQLDNKDLNFKEDEESDIIL